MENCDGGGNTYLLNYLCTKCIQLFYVATDTYLMCYNMTDDKNTHISLIPGFLKWVSGKRAEKQHKFRIKSCCS